MKVAVSIPDPIFDQAEALARHLKLPRSKVYARALSEYVANHPGLSLTEQMNATLDEIGEMEKEDVKAIVQAGSRTVLKHSEW
jgi:metal-responsive CopG/Arc/MetJ family transcriptional regulator